MQQGTRCGASLDFVSDGASYIALHLLRQVKPHFNTWLVLEHLSTKWALFLNNSWPTTFWVTLALLIKTKNNDDYISVEETTNTTISLGCSRDPLRVGIMCFLLTKLSLQFDIRYDRSRIDGKHFLWSLTWVGIWNAAGLWCNWRVGKVVTLSVFELLLHLTVAETQIPAQLSNAPPRLEADYVKYWIQIMLPRASVIKWWHS